MNYSSWAQRHYEKPEHDPDYLSARAMIEVNEQIVRRMTELGISQRDEQRQTAQQRNEQLMIRRG